MPDFSSSLPSLLGEALGVVSSGAAPPDELFARIVARVRVTPIQEIMDGLHILWPFTRHIRREEWLKALSFDLKDDPSPPALCEEAQLRLRQMQIEYDAIRPDFGNMFDRLREFIRKRQLGAEAISGAIAQTTALVHRDLESAGEGPQSSPPGGPSTSSTPVDPMSQYLPQDEYCEGDATFWYSDSLDDEVMFACRLLRTIALEVKLRVNDAPLFWGVLGRIYEPLALDEPDTVSAKVEAGRIHTLNARVERGLADLLDYLNYFDAYRDFDQDDLEAETQSFLAALKRASAAECEALFPTVQRLEYEANSEPPRPAEAFLPVADTVWDIILSKPGLSRGLLGRAGFFYWMSEKRAQGPSTALATLGLLCEGDCAEFWRVLPFQPLWAAARAATGESQWSFALLCLKRALVDITVLAPGLNSSEIAHVYAFNLDPRFIRDIQLHSTDADASLLGLAFKLALHGLSASNLDDWSQLHFVLNEAARRLGAKGRLADDARLRDNLGEELVDQVDAKTWEFLLDAEANWTLLEQRLVKDDQYQMIGIAYRCAIEHEWRQRIGRPLSALDPNLHQDRAMLGEMIRAVKDRSKSQVGRQVLKQRLPVRGDSRLFDQLFLQRASSMVNTLLHPAAHPSGLDRTGCKALRSQLFEQGMLRDLLACVQTS